MNLIKKIVVYSIGLLFLAVGVTISIKSDLGVSPVNSIPYVLSCITPFNQGHLIFAIFSFYVFIQIGIQKRDFKLINLFQLAFAAAFGYFVNFTNYLINFESPSNYLLRFGLLMVSIVCIAIGVTLYLRANLLPMPAEGCMIAIQGKTNHEFSKIKSFFDTLSVIIAGILAIAFLGQLSSVREGTIIAAVLVGKTIGLIQKCFASSLESLDRFLLE